MPPDHDLSTRLQRLEEAHGFAEHAADQMLDHLRAIDRTVRDLARRVESLEARMISLLPLKPATNDGSDATRSGEE